MFGVVSVDQVSRRLHERLNRLLGRRAHMDETHDPRCDCAECRRPERRRSAADVRELRRRLSGLIGDATLAQSQLDKRDYVGAEHSIDEVTAGLARVLEQALVVFGEKR